MIPDNRPTLVQRWQVVAMLALGWRWPTYVVPTLAQHKIANRLQYFIWPRLAQSWCANVKLLIKYKKHIICLATSNQTNLIICVLDAMICTSVHKSRNNNLH